VRKSDAAAASDRARILRIRRSTSRERLRILATTLVTLNVVSISSSRIDRAKRWNSCCAMGSFSGSNASIAVYVQSETNATLVGYGEWANASFSSDDR